MSLRVWFPLNGHLNNQGLGSDTATASGSAVINNTGKLGQCYSFGTAVGAIEFTPTTVSSFTEDFSFSMWFNLATWNSNYNTLLYCGPSSQAWAGYTFGLLRNGTTSNLVFVVSDGTNSTQSSLQSTAISLNTWYHIACTYSQGKMKIYLNGVLNKEFTTTIKPKYSNIQKCFIGAQNASGQYQTNSKINDVRIYDHCLSLKEIQELSRGLVCHYALNNNGIGTPNLIAKMVDCNRNFVQVNDYSLKGTMGNGDTYCRFSVPTALISGNTYTLSFDVSGLQEGTNWTFSIGNNAKYKYTITKNGHHKQTFVPLSTDNGMDNLSKFLWDDQGQTNPQATPVEISNIKIEAGSQDSNWCPYISNTNYPFFYGDNTKEYDNSGYGHSAVRAGSFSYSTDTPRYDCSTVFNGSNTGITLPIKELMNNLLKNQCTINFWCKEGNTASRSVYFGGYDSSPFNIEMSGSQFRVYWNGSPDIYTSTISNNIWTMWTVVIDTATGIKIYKDSQLVSTHSSALSSLTCSGDFWLGKDSRTGDTMFEGAMSDFRIYATALNAEAIKELYQIPATIDKLGNLHGITYRELNEKQEFYKKGIIDCSLWESYQNFQALKNTVALNENLFKNSNSFGLTGSDFSSVSTRTVGKVVVSSDSVGNAYSWIQSSIEGGMTSIFNSTKTMTLSIDIKVENATKANAYGLISIDYRKGDHSALIQTTRELIMDGKWHRYVLPITANNGGQVQSLLCLANFQNLNGATIYYKNIKFEEGAIGTPWCPSVSEGFSTDIETSRGFIIANQFYEV